MAIDQSSSITTGGTAQNVFWANPDNTTKITPPNGYAIYNVDPANDLWVSENGVAAAANTKGSVRIAANGGWYETPSKSGAAPAGTVSIVGATTGQQYTARYW